MERYVELEVIDRDGWRKAFRVPKSIIFIGSSVGNDIVLARQGSEQVAPRHAQLLSLSEGYRLINLGETDILLGSTGDQALRPKAFAKVASGQRIQIGGFTLILGGSRGSMSSVGTGESASGAIRLQLFMPRSELEPGYPIEGSVKVQNLGDQPGVQFSLEVLGLGPDCYDIGPGPILFPSAEKDVFIFLRHPQGPEPPAGKHRFTVRATAPQAYPGQSVEVSHEIDILPFYRHELRLVAPGPAKSAGRR